MKKNTKKSSSKNSQKKIARDLDVSPGAVGKVRGGTGSEIQIIKPIDKSTPMLFKK